MAGLDKRIMPRLPVTAGNYVIYTEGSGTIRDISAGGLFIEDSAPLPEGTVFSFDVRVGNSDVPVRGTVRRSVPGVGMGVQFQQLSGEGKNQLERLLVSLQKAQKPVARKS